MQHVAIIGGTDMNGQCVVDYALQKGLIVRWLYRNEHTIPERFRGKVQLMQGNVTNYEDCRRVVKGVNAVSIVLGTQNKLEAPTDLSTATANLIMAMKEAYIKRFSIIMYSFLLSPLSEMPAVFHRFSKEHKRMLNLTLSSKLKYIVILAPHIADEPPSGYTITYDVTPGSTISKYDLAKFVIDSLETPPLIGKICGITKMNSDMS